MLSVSINRFYLVCLFFLRLSDLNVAIFMLPFTLNSPFSPLNGFPHFHFLYYVNPMVDSTILWLPSIWYTAVLSITSQKTMCKIKSESVLTFGMLTLTSCCFLFIFYICNSISELTWNAAIDTVQHIRTQMQFSRWHFSCHLLVDIVKMPKCNTVWVHPSMKNFISQFESIWTISKIMRKMWGKKG